MANFLSFDGLEHYHEKLIAKINSLLNGKANSSHKHSASDINSGTLPVDRGGTGGNTVATARTSLGVYSTSEVDNKLNGKSDTSHKHDNLYDAKGSANSALTSANTYTNGKIGEVEVAWLETIGIMYGSDWDGENEPSSIREIATEESAKVQTNLNNHSSDTSLHFTPEEKTKLSGIESGAQKNTITGVKGGAESSYRTGNVNITKGNIGLGNVDNTSDANKPVSTAQSAAINNALASAKSYTEEKINAIVGEGASETLDTIGEIADAIEANQGMLQTLNQAIGNKVNKESGKGLSTNDFTTSYKNKLDGIAQGAEVNQNAFGKIIVGDTSIEADAEVDELTFIAGSNVTLTPSASGDSITITAKDTTYSAATTSANGLMTSAMVTKLNSIADNANNYVHPTHTAVTGVPTANQTPGFGQTFTVNQITNNNLGHVTGNTSRTITIPATLSSGANTAGLIKTSSTITNVDGYTACPVVNGVPYYKDTNTTYTLEKLGVTATAAELNVLDGITSTTAQLNSIGDLTTRIGTAESAIVTVNNKVDAITAITNAQIDTLFA